jgi:hypothetical protein
MADESFGAEELTEEDRIYHGSRFSEVREALFANPYQKVWGGAGEPPLPGYEVTMKSIVAGLRQASSRTVDSHADLRWGADRKGFRRLLHPNGVCLTGRWKIDANQETQYSGYFRRGSEALLVGRYSTCCTETRRGHMRSLALIGKLFPTLDADHAEPLQTASFFTQQDFGGEKTEHANDAELRNAPDTRLWRRGLGAPILALSGVDFLRADKEPTIRQLYQIAELGKPPDEPTRAPAFLRLLMADEQPRIAGEELDFRDEILAQIYDRGDPAPKRTLTFHIEVTDDGETHGTPFYQRRTFGAWRRIGKLVFDQAVASYNGDCVIHFNHPTWREDRNDPATATRVNGRKVR